MTPAYLLHEHSVVALKRLEDVVVTAQRPKAVDCCIAMTATGLSAHVQRCGGVGCGVRLQARTQGMHLLHQPEQARQVNTTRTHL